MKVFIGPYKDDGSDQEVSVTIDDYDVYSMDHTLAYIIEPMLLKLANHKHGSPFVENSDVPKELWCPEGFYSDTGDVDENHHERWSWVINEMIWAFHQKNYDWEDQYHSGQSDIYFEDIGNGYTEMKRGPNDTFEIDVAGLNDHRKRMAKGFELFGKYYEALWD